MLGETLAFMLIQEPHLKSYHSFVAHITEAVAQAQRKLWVFDFDDTIARSSSMVTVRNAQGEEIGQVNSHDYKSLVLRPGDYIDYDQFGITSDGTTAVKKWFGILKKVHDRGDPFLILTARDNIIGARKWLEEMGIRNPHIIAVGMRLKDRVVRGSKREIAAAEKARVLAAAAREDRFSDIVFVDDDIANIDAARRIKNKIPSRLTVIHAEK